MLKNECTRNCWLAAAVAGLLVWLFNMFGGMFFGGLILGLLTFFLLGSLLVWALCQGRGGLSESADVLGAEAAAHTTPEHDGGVLDRAEAAVVNASAAFAASTVAAVEKGREALRERRENAGHDADDEKAAEASGDRTSKDGKAELTQAGADDGGPHDDAAHVADTKAALAALAERGKAESSAVAETETPDSADGIGAGPSSDKDAGDDLIVEPADDGAPTHAGSDTVSPGGRAAIPTPASAAEGRDDAADKATASKPKPTAKAKASEADADPKPGPKKAAKPDKQKPVKGDAKPEAADDLKEIKGIGPQLEKLLHENDIVSFAQIAGWSDADIDHFAELIGRMGGRIRSDDWVAQAKVLASGGETEFSARVEKGEVY
ncbi:hypothetical protein FQV27_07985 [Paracoccus aurantiacus]|uniref:Endonuclease n=1 Tax=Paracoccus aurantiacus TaxID=2599412 RepID=A0A5C6S6H6_9RHOB|nr:hypothetical protein [Paracoccus aurantiacus]TXB70025.1 hypothetical protein FQV27_07985 [Paracoccus aurantiacus]